MKSVVLSLILTVFAFSVQGGKEDWTGLRVTYSTNKDAKGAFEQMPKSCIAAKKAGWKKIGGEDVACSRGYRYMLNDDPAVVLIYSLENENNNLIGLETGFPESQMKSDEQKAWFKQQPMFQVVHPEYNKSETLYTVKVYFTDPDKVCDKDSKLVPNFYYMNGTNKVLVSRDESKITDKLWAPGKCLPGKGDHEYYEFTKDMNCDNFQPLFLMYHNKQLIAFSFVVFGQFDSPRYGADEYHPKEQYPKLVSVVPDCLYKVSSNLTTFHGYLIDKPWNIDCKK